MSFAFYSVQYNKIPLTDSQSTDLFAAVRTRAVYP
jgi:hypothetical protein